MRRITFCFAIFLISAMISGCSGSDFSAGAYGTGKSNDTDDKNDDPSSTDDFFDTEGLEPSDELVIGSSMYDDNTLIMGETIEVLKQKCWFAVSGTFVGMGGSPTHADVFPKTKSGDPIGHGEIFDTVGGVFLEAREEPYEHGKGDKEIDLAIRWTFDGIVVAPDMKALIKDSSGTVLFDGEGPYIGISQYYYNRFGASYYNTLKAKSSLPEWMNDYVDDHSKVESLKLQSARYVKVSSVKGSKCDWD